MARKAKRSLGESLVEDGIITLEQFKTAQAEESKTGQRLRKIVVMMGMMTETDMAKAAPPPPSSNAVVIPPAAGSVAAVAMRKTMRTTRALPDTALADHVNVDHAIHNIANRSQASVAPVHVG